MGLRKTFYPVDNYFFVTGSHIKSKMMCWPRLYPIHDAAAPDTPAEKMIWGKVVEFECGDECRANKLIIESY